MTAIDKQSPTSNFNSSYFISDYITPTKWFPIWLIFLAYITFRFAFTRLGASPVSTGIVLALWIGTIAWMAMNLLNRRSHNVTDWLKDNLYSSITNALLTLLLSLGIISAIQGFYGYAVTNASFSLDPDVAKEVTRAGKDGARWGSVIDNFDNLLVFRMIDHMERVYLSLGLIVVLIILSVFIYRGKGNAGSWPRRILTFLWLLSPVLLTMFLRGFGENGVFGSGLFPALDIDQVWGGLLLSVICALFGIVVSFPAGVLLALGRRSEIYGIPKIVTYVLAAVGTAYFLFTSTPAILANARGLGSTILAFWPLAIPLIAYIFQKTWNGNVVAAFSTLYIELIRGAPFITILFMSIILFPIFLPKDLEIGAVPRVLAAFAMFSSAYLAENVRGGLQAIPRGQYEAADSLGLSAFNKYRKIILPQAIRLVIPAIVGQFIGLFKDTSLVFLVGLLDFLAVANAISAQPDWLTVRTEPYIFLMFVYFILSSLMAGYSRRLEAQLAVGQR